MLTRVAELRELVHRRTAERLERAYPDLEQSLAESAADLVMAGVPEGAAVGEVRDAFEKGGWAAIPGRIAEILGVRKAANG